MYVDLYVIILHGRTQEGFSLGGGGGPIVPSWYIHLL